MKYFNFFEYNDKRLFVNVKRFNPAAVGRMIIRRNLLRAS